MFRPYSGAGNLREELLQLARENSRIAQAVTIGRSVSGKPITAVRVSKNVAHLKDRQRPAVVYQAAQHAREWITPEMVRRLLRHYLDGYGRDRELTKIVDTTDLWFIPVVNVDGYDYTFTEGNRLWRKNLRDNDGDGEITAPTASTSTATSPTSGATTTRAPRRTSSPRPTAARRRAPSPRRRPRSGSTTASGPSTRSTGTRPPSCCCTASAGRR